MRVRQFHDTFGGSFPLFLNVIEIQWKVLSMTRMAKTVREWMTRISVEVDRRDPLSLASDLMRRHGIRHLPVLDGYHLYGIVSDRDLTRAQSRKRPASGGLCLGGICERDVLTVALPLP